MSRKIMILGTGSSVGKSIIVAGLCRALNNRGYRVAPFKSQNMSNNSFITKDGKEMGRAQVFQAQAARIEPAASMNPILLKPTTDVGSQVIVMGEVYGNYAARDYFKEKEKLLPIAVEALRSLEAQYDPILIEGAGSPAEINLRSRDIVNMGFAEAVDSTAILVGDVDRGGVFASLYGTYLLLSEDERQRIVGFIVNKFRGDVSLLMPGVDQIAGMMGIPCIGVLPYIPDLRIDDEDSANEIASMSPSSDAIRIGIIRLRHISNFTDFTVFYREPDVEVRYVERPDDLRDFDLIVIPGSKSTVQDMAFLQESGLADAILREHDDGRGTPILGICGGYQILGSQIEDRFGVECEQPTAVSGLGLLPVITSIGQKKMTMQSAGVVQAPFLTEGLRGIEIRGYEIHMGTSRFYFVDDSPEAFIRTQDHVDGCVSDNGCVAGTYFHGIFDNDEFRTAILNELRRRKGMPCRESLESSSLADREFDRLARVLEQHLDIDRLIGLMRE